MNICMYKLKRTWNFIHVGESKFRRLRGNFQQDGPDRENVYTCIEICKSVYSPKLVKSCRNMDDRWRSALENLPVGWRFRPYDEEVLDCYLKRKLTGSREADEDGFDLSVIELNKYDPRDLIAKFKHGSRDKEMYFFSPCEYYKNGSLRKRKAGGGYWKSTGEPRPVTLDDTGDVIGTKRSLVFHDPDSTNFIITEYRYTAPLVLESETGSELPRDKFVICKLKVKLNRKKIMTRKSKEAAPDCGHTPPKKKARKVNLSDSNRASTAWIQNTEKTFTSLARGEHESTNHMASHLHKKHIDKSTDTKKSQDHCFEKQFPVEKTDDSSNDNGAYDPGKCLSEPVDYQNECHKINVSTHEDCKSSSISCKVGDTASKVETQCMKDILVREDDTGPFIFCKNGDIASKGETQFKKDISVLGDETGPLISCKVGDTASKVETQYTKDISVLKDDTGPSISCKVGDIASKAETQCKKDISVLEDDTGPWMGFSLDEIEFPLITFRELEEILAFPEAESAVNSLLTDYSLDIGTQNPNSAEDNCNPFTETPDGFITFDKPEMSDKFFPD